MADKSVKLSIVVAAQDLASGKLDRVNKELRGMGAASKAATYGLGGILATTNKVGSAFSTLKGRVSGLVGAMGPLLGIGAGLGIAAFFTDAISKTEKWGDATLRLKSIIGGTTEEVSGIVDTLGDWGIAEERQQKILGFGEKAIFKYTKSTKEAKKFQAAFGISLVDAKGKAVGMTEALRRSAALLQSNANQTQKNAAMTALWGKGWQELLPVIGHGTAFFDKQFGSADRLTKQQLKDVRALATAQQSFNDSLDRLKVAIGLQIIPLLTPMVRRLGTFIDKNKGAITNALKNAIGLAQSIGAAFASVVSGLAGLWSKVPAPLQDLLIKGAVADRTFKFLFGFSPAKIVVDVAENLIGKAIGSIAGGIFQRGGSPATPMFVSDVGLPGGKPGLPPGATPPGATPPGGNITIPAIGAGIAMDIKPIMDNALQSSNRAYVAAMGGQKAMSANIVGAINSLKPHIDAIKTGPSGVIQVFRDYGSSTPRRRRVDRSRGGRNVKSGFLSQSAEGHAAGGPVTGGRPILVGELGPEVFVPHGSGRIVPNAKGKPKTKADGMPVFVTNWPAAGAAAGIGGGGDLSGGSAATFHTHRLGNRHSAAHAAALAGAFDVHVHLPRQTLVSAREVAQSARQWRRVTSGNGSGISIR